MNNKQYAQEESDLPKLGAPAECTLTGAGIQRLEQLTSLSENGIRQLHGVQKSKSYMALETMR
ncbi:MAG: hypothetical protein M3R47_21230 [Chloroflexota bacterium]|nr:hypothetical protein [Chloroflexota bacterium]